ncbi:MAG: HIT family protein [Bacillota bacterium]|nr:HIT family protein [Bacillota bacterium]
MCIFCSIVKGDIPNYTVYEDDKVLAFLDVNPTSVGHTLVIPKTHYSSLLTCDPEDLAYLMKVAQQLGNQLKEKLGAEGMNILSNAGAVAGQSVEHFHVHLIPRYKDDQVKIEFAQIEKPNFTELLEKIK